MGEISFQVFDLTHDQPRMHQQLLARRRQFHATAVAVQQTRLELLLQRLDPRAGGSRRQESPARALGQARRLADVDEKAQVSQVEMHGGILPSGVRQI